MKKTGQDKGDIDDPINNLEDVDPTCTVREPQGCCGCVAAFEKAILHDRVAGSVTTYKQRRCTVRSCIGVDVTLRVVLLYAAVTVGGVDGASQDGLLSDVTTKVVFAVSLQLLAVAMVAGPFLSWGLQRCARYVNTRVFAMNRVERHYIAAINDQA